MDASHSVCYNVDDLIFSKTEYILCWKTSFARFKPGFFWSGPDQTRRSQVWTWQKLVFQHKIYSVFEKIKSSTFYDVYGLWRRAVNGMTGQPADWKSTKKGTLSARKAGLVVDSGSMVNGLTVLHSYQWIQSYREAMKRIEVEADLTCGISILIPQDLEAELHLESSV